MQLIPGENIFLELDFPLSIFEPTLYNRKQTLCNMCGIWITLNRGEFQEIFSVVLLKLVLRSRGEYGLTPFAFYNYFYFQARITWRIGFDGESKMTTSRQKLLKAIVFSSYFQFVS